MTTRLDEAARDALACAQVEAKLAQVDAMVRDYRSGALRSRADFTPHPPSEPGRPALPRLVAPRALARRSTATPHGHAALVHAIAHIEFNAINLALDAICRFPGLPDDYYGDWLRVAAEEALHYALLAAHLAQLGCAYGDFPAHDGLWEMALKTARDPLARMALVPRVLEARGLDASPAIIRRLRECGDEAGARIVERILHDEVAHVAIGSRWFRYLCAARTLDPDMTFEALLAQHGAPRAVLPLNVDARKRADFSAAELAYIERSAHSRRASESNR